MSDSTSVYNTSQQAKKIDKIPCLKNKEHKWQERGSWPSLWYKCKYCELTKYTK